MVTVRELDRITARVIGPSRSAGARLDTYREGATFFIDIDLPGVDPADIDVVVDRQVLTVTACRQRSEGGAAAPADCSAGRQIELSDTLDTDRLEARFDAGVLTLRIPITTPTT